MIFTKFDWILEKVFSKKKHMLFFLFVAQSDPWEPWFL